MGEFRATFLNEIEKIYKKKKVIVIVIISLFTIVFSQLITTAARYGLGYRFADSSYFPKMVLFVFVYTVLPLFTALVAIDIFTGEFSHNTMKIAMLRPVTRLKLFSAKVSAIAFFVIINLLFVMVLSLVTGLLFNPMYLTFSAILKIIVSYVITIIPVMTFALLVVVFANILRSGVAVFFLSIIIFLVSLALGFVYPQFSNLFVTSMLGWFNTWNIDPLPLPIILREFLIMLGYGIMFFTAGYSLFDKRDM